MVSILVRRSQVNFYHLLYVRDTVQSTGMLVNRVLPFTAANCVIRVFRHALSLDEVYPIHNLGWNFVDSFA